LELFLFSFFLTSVKIVVGIFWECSGLSSLLDMKSYGQVLTEIGKLISSNNVIDKAYALAGNLSPNEQQNLVDSGYQVRIELEIVALDKSF
jgi:hypothetical protein